MLCSPTIPDASAPVADFTQKLGLPRDSAVAWARGVIADVAHHCDPDIMRACKVIIANDNAFLITATELLRAVEKDAGHA